MSHLMIISQGYHMLIIGKGCDLTSCGLTERSAVSLNGDGVNLEMKPGVHLEISFSCGTYLEISPWCGVHFEISP